MVTFRMALATTVICGGMLGCPKPEEPSPPQVVHCGTSVDPLPATLKLSLSSPSASVSLGEGVRDGTPLGVLYKTSPDTYFQALNHSAAFGAAPGLFDRVGKTMRERFASWPTDLVLVLIDDTAEAAWRAEQQALAAGEVLTWGREFEQSALDWSLYRGTKTADGDSAPAGDQYVYSYNAYRQLYINIVVTPGNDCALKAIDSLDRFGEGFFDEVSRLVVESGGTLDLRVLTSLAAARFLAAYDPARCTTSSIAGCLDHLDDDVLPAVLDDGRDRTALKAMDLHTDDVWRLSWASLENL